MLNVSVALRHIRKNGILLTFPVKNQKEPASLWSQFFPRSQMRWAWDAESDQRISDMWSLMKKISASREVIYSKWYRGRATFFSREVFTALLCRFQNKLHPQLKLLPTAEILFEALESNSPLSTKQLKLETDLRGKDNEPAYNQSMKQLFETLLIIGFGEVDDGAFPSLAVGTTNLMFEDLWAESAAMSPAAAEKVIETFFTPGSALHKFLNQVEQKYETR